MLSRLWRFVRNVNRAGVVAMAHTSDGTRFGSGPLAPIPLAAMIFTGGLIRLRTQRVTFVGRGGVASSGRVAGSGMMLVFGHRPLLMCCRVVFDALLRGFFMYFFPRFIAHVFTVVGIRSL